ncbi:putative ubiquitin conjugating protein [Zalerion maritima]|uniref:Ubiquitin conjugating protein n=1 Tax=Zalerion maritima TaxID=339359 RepID=A0AAD5RQV8_9PEZI|nr:putative ubiquitin conjugating protein [Zalerion maritima]
MISHYSGLVPLGKRTVEHMSGSMGGHMGMMEGGDSPNQDTTVYPGWFFIASLVMLVVFLPVMFYLSYTLNNLLPTLAMIEDPSPPAYEPLSNNPDDAEAPAPAVSGPITSSLRQTSRMLRSIGGFKSFFRGFWCAFVASMAMSLAQNFFAAFLPNFAASLLAPLPAIMITLPLTTAWTHIIMSAPKSAPWYRRLPPSRKTFAALWRPALVVWLAVGISTSVPAGMLAAFGISKDAMAKNSDVSGLGWKIPLTLIIGLVLGLGLMVPSHVLFTRIQASLLPVDDEPIIAFDRSFGGNVEPEVVGGKGYATMAQAWKTFSRENWMRLIKLYAKVIGVSFAAYLVMAAVFVPTWIVALKHSHHEPVGST